MDTSKLIEEKGGLIVLAVVVVLVSLFRPTVGSPVASYKSMEPVADAEVKEAMKATAESALLAGIDVSHYQGKVDWPKVATQDIGFVYLKATDGITYTDPMYHQNQAGVNEQKLPNGAYHFFEPNDDGVKQAENFLSQVKQHDYMLPPVLDVEVSKGVDKALLQKRVQQWLDKVEAELGCQPIIYSYDSFYENNLGTGFEKYRFWLADYQKKPNLPKGVDQWVYWQYSQSGKVDGVLHSVDRNWYKGTPEQLSSMMCHAAGGKA